MCSAGGFSFATAVYLDDMTHGTRSIVSRELEAFIFDECEPDAQAALLATIAAGQEHVITLHPEGTLSLVIHRLLCSACLLHAGTGRVCSMGCHIATQEPNAADPKQNFMYSSTGIHIFLMCDVAGRYRFRAALVAPARPNTAARFEHL